MTPVSDCVCSNWHNQQQCLIFPLEYSFGQLACLQEDCQGFASQCYMLHHFSNATSAIIDVATGVWCSLQLAGLTFCLLCIGVQHQRQDIVSLCNTTTLRGRMQWGPLPVIWAKLKLGHILGAAERSDLCKNRCWSWLLLWRQKQTRAVQTTQTTHLFDETCSICSS